MSSLFDLTGKVAIVTGSTKGIGLAIVKRMAEHGATVVVSSRKLDACEAVAKDIRGAGGKAVVIPCHVAHKDQLQNLVDRTLAECGGIDIVVSNAAVNPYLGPQAGASDEVFDRIMGTNVRSNFWLSNMTCPHLAARGGGSFIIISSIGGLLGDASIGLYCVSKAADIALVRNICVEWGPKNVRANAIAPGLVRTDFARALWEDPVRYKKTTRDAPLGRIGEPDEIAGAAIFLASSSGSFTSGQTIVIDGGRMAGAPLHKDD
ncbi:MAG: SDR family oxidoreductase [Acetobacteraceae bacterium]|nr:SDR family oxidoreductase [Acetobacteraceae bacterium]